MKQAALVISLIALMGVVVLFLKGTGLEKTSRDNSPIAPGATDEQAGGHEEEIEVAVYMGRIQRFHQKFWLALRAGNGELAQFYLHEMEEAMEEIADAGVVDEGVDISSNMRTYGLDVNRHLQAKLKNEGVQAAHQEGDLLVNACNSCHKASGYEIIKIRVPQDLEIPDQDLSPTEPRS